MAPLLTSFRCRFDESRLSVKVTLVARAALDHPSEDAFLLGSRQLCFAVADGVTRREYPDPFAGAKMAATILACTAVTKLDNWGDPTDVEQAFRVANRKIGVLNQVLSSDTSQPYSTVGIAGIIDQNMVLHYSHLGDCGLTVFRPNWAIGLLSQDQIQATREHLAARHFHSLSERYTYVDTHLRNKPDARDDKGKRVGFCTLTGEDESLAMLTAEALQLSEGDRVVVYSDGAQPFVTADVVRQMLNESSMPRLAPERFDRERDDITMLVISLTGASQDD